MYLLHNRIILHKINNFTKIISLSYAFFLFSFFTSYYLKKGCSFYINYVNLKGLIFS